MEEEEEEEQVPASEQDSDGEEADTPTNLLISERREREDFIICAKDQEDLEIATALRRWAEDLLAWEAGPSVRTDKKMFLKIHP